MKLHLGCGEKYLEGYLNVDFPPIAHTVQRQSPADLHADLLQLKYPLGSVDEIRLHHVFEHFTRPIACALLAAWHSWLKIDGILHLEVPDFTRTATVIINPMASVGAKAVAMRHLFGSHEAAWAVHCEGYTQGALKTLLESYGFQVFETRRNSWQGTHNFEMLAKKVVAIDTLDDFRGRTRDCLRRYLLDASLEEPLLETWMNMFDQQLKMCIGTNG